MHMPNLTIGILDKNSFDFSSKMTGNIVWSWVFIKEKESCIIPFKV